MYTLGLSLFYTPNLDQSPHYMVNKIERLAREHIAKTYNHKPSGFLQENGL